MSLEDKIQNKFKDFESKPPNNGWQALSKKLDTPFETAIAQKIGNVEFAPNASAWVAIASGLDGSLENIIKQKVENHTANPPATVWEGIDAQMANSEAFEQSVANKVEGVEASVPNGTWKYIAAHLDKLVAAKRRRQILTAAAILIGAIIPSSNLLDNWADFSGLYFAENDVADKTNYNPASASKNVSLYPSNTEKADNAEIQANENSKIGQVNGKMNRHQKAFPPAQNELAKPNNHTKEHSAYAASNEKFSDRNSKLLTSFSMNERYIASIDDEVLLEGAIDKHQHINPIISKLDDVIETINEKTDVAIFSISSGPSNQNFSANADLAEFARFNNGLDTRGWYSSISGGFGFQLRSRFQLGIGLGITQATTQMNFSIIEPTVEYRSSYKKVNYATNSNTILEKSKTSSQMGLFTDGLDKTITVGSDYTLISEFTWIDIPLSLTYTLPLNDKLGFVFTGGVSGRFLLNAHAFLPSLNKGSIVEIDATFANEFYKPYLGAFGGMALQFSLLNNLNIQLGFEHLSGLTSIVRTDEYINIKPSQTGLKLSVIQKI